MSLSRAEFESILSDTSKTVKGDILWKPDLKYDLWLKFKAAILLDRETYVLTVHGTYNTLIEALSYVIICPQYGRIYGLDMGEDHRNPDGKLVGEKHKHRWSEIYRDKEAYVPPDITAPANDPVEVWLQFCEEATIRHNGVMQPVPEQQLDMFI